MNHVKQENDLDKGRDYRDRDKGVDDRYLEIETTVFRN